MFFVNQACQKFMYIIFGKLNILFHLRQPLYDPVLFNKNTESVNLSIWSFVNICMHLNSHLTEFNIKYTIILIEIDRGFALI